MKRYTFEVTIDEGSEEFWEEILVNNKTGCDDVLEIIKNTLWQNGIDVKIKLVKYEDK